MIHTRFCDLMGIAHPVSLGGMASIPSPALTAAVSEAGGLGHMGVTAVPAEEMAARAEEIRERTEKPFGLNFLLFRLEEERFAAALETRPHVMAFAWPRQDQDLKTYFARAHEAGSKVLFMAGGVPEAVKGAEAGADIIVAQGTEGGGHIGWMASMVLLPLVVDAVSPLPVLAAGGFADGRGLAAALALGADGVLMGTRFLASVESPLHPNFKQAILASDGHDTEISEIPDIAIGQVWPGAMARVLHNRLFERWAGRAWALRLNQPQVFEQMTQARQAGDRDEAFLYAGQDAGLISDLPPAGELVRRIVEEAEAILKEKLPGLMKSN